MTETTKNTGPIKSTPSQACSEGLHTSTQAITIGFIGAGAVAKTLATSFSRHGYPVVAISSRSGRSAKELASTLKGCSACKNNQEVADAAKLVFMATPDSEIARVAKAVNWHAGGCVVHCSGALSIDTLEPARKAGCATGSLHPLQSFTTNSPCNLSGVTFAIEAEGELLEALKALSVAVGGSYVIIKPTDKALYHLSAVLVSNYLVTLVNLACELWEEMGFTREKALQALLPLLRGVVTNLEEISLPDSLTGPISRGDIQTVEKHLETLSQRRPDLTALYCELASRTIPLAREKGGLSGAKEAQLKFVISKYQGANNDKGA